MRNRNGSDQGTTNKEQILAKLRNALIEKPEAQFEDIDLRTDTWKPISEEDGTAITFVQHFKELGGIFIYLESEAEFGECIKQLAPQNNWEPLWCTSHKMQELLEKYGVNYSDTPTKDSKQRIVSITDCDYLIAHTEEHGLTNFRVDKMTNIRLTQEPRVHTEETEKLDLSRYGKEVFGMFNGERAKVRMRFENSLSGVVIDRFGKDVMLIPDGDGHFTCTEEIMVSPVFFAWFASFGTRAKLLSPESVVRGFRETIEQIQTMYEREEIHE